MPSKMKNMPITGIYPTNRDLRPEATSTVQKLYKAYVQGMEVLNKPYVFFGEKNPLQYWADGRLRFNVYVPQRKKNSKEWKTLYRSAKTRNKCLGLIAHLIGMTISPSIQAANERMDEDVVAAQFFRDAIEYSQENEQFGTKLFWGLTTAVAEGTVIFEDNYATWKRKVKDITDWDEATGKLKWTEKEKDEFTGAYTDIVPNDEILVPDPFITSIQEQPWIMRRRRMTFEQAKLRYGHYENWHEVIPGAPTGWVYTSDYFQPYSAVSFLSHDMVEVLTYYQKDGDHMDVVANGIQLTEDNHPNPRQDKQYPFAKSGYEPIDYNFFWFKSLTDKMSPEQDVYDTMLRMVIDRQHLDNIPALKTNNPALVNEEIIIPGNTVFTGNNETMKLEPILPQQQGQAGTAALLQAMQTNMDQSSIDPMQMGQSPSGGVPTATQSIQMAYNAKVMIGMFGWMIGMLVTEWTRLRLSTIIWRLNQDEDLSKITLADRVLNNGKLGRRSYMFERGLAKHDLESKLQISHRIRELENSSQGKHEAVGLDPDELSKLSTFVKLDAQLKPRRTDELMQALAMEKWNVYSTRPDVFNLNAAAVKLAQAWGDDPDEMVIASTQDASGVNSGATGQAPGQALPSSVPSSQAQTPISKKLSGSIGAKLGLTTNNPATNALAV